MKKTLSALLTVALVAGIFCGCAVDANVELTKAGKSTVTTTMKIAESEFVVYGESTKAALGTKEEYIKNGLGTEEEYDEYIKSVDEMLDEMKKDMKKETIDGKEYYVQKETEKYGNIKKLNKAMSNNGDFDAFEMTTKDLVATVADLGSQTSMYGGITPSITTTFKMPYKVIKTNGKLASDGKTVTFDFMKKSGKKIYAYTYKSNKILKAPKLKLTAGKKKFTAKITAAKDQKGLQIRYRLKGKSKWKVKTYKSKKTVKKTIKSLKSGKKYQVQVRSTGKLSGYKLNSDWSKTYSVKVK